MSRRSTRLTIVWTALTFAVLMLVGSALLAETAREFWGAALLQFGSTLVLIPVIIYVERAFERRAEEWRSSVVKALAGSSSIEGSMSWDAMHAIMDRIGSSQYTTTLEVKVPRRELWLDFGTYKTYQLGQYSSVIWINLKPPGERESRHGDSMVTWTEEMSLVQAVTRVSRVLYDDPNTRSLADFDADEVISAFRERVKDAIG